MLGLILLTEIGVLAPADLARTTGSFAERKLDDWMPAAFRESDATHYAAHLLAGRVLSLCPCTRRPAARQYAKATWHARSRRQLALVTTHRPHSLGGLVIDTVQLGLSSIKWIAGQL